MPKVRPLTRVEREMQSDEVAVAKASREFLDLLGAERGRKDMSRQDFSEAVGITRQTYCNWRRDGIGKASFGRLVSIARRAGFRVQFVPNESPR